MKRIFLIFVWVLMAGIPSLAEDFSVVFDEMSAQAKSTQKPLVVMVGSMICYHCDRMREKVIPDSRVQSALSKVLYIDVDKENGPLPSVLQAQARSTPTFFYFSPDGELVGGRYGFMNVEQFLEFLEKPEP